MFYSSQRGGDPRPKKWLHPMERLGFSELYVEAKMAMDKFQKPLGEWLRTVPKLERDFQLLLYKLSIAEESYYNTPPDKRFTFFNRS